MMKMNEKKLKLLIEYLEVLSKIEGNYHSEINNAIKAIESEFRISRNENKERSGFISNGLISSTAYKTNTKGVAESTVKEMYNSMGDKEGNVHSTKIEFTPDSIHLRANKINLGENITKE